MIEIFIDGFKDFPIITTLVAIFLLLIIGLCIWYVIDAWFLPNIKGEGIVINKKFTPAHTTIMLIYNAATKTSLPTPIYHDDKWELTIEMKKLRDTIEITQEQFDKLSNGDIAKITYSYGRLSSELYIKECLN